MKVQVKKGMALEDAGAALVEYCLVLSLLALVAVPALSSLGGQVKQQFGQVSTEMSAQQAIAVGSLGNGGIMRTNGSSEMAGAGDTPADSGSHVERM